MQRSLISPLRARCAVVGLAVGLATAVSALAAPAVLDRVPDDAMLVIGVGSPESAQKNIAALAQSVQSSMPIPSAEDMLTLSGLGSSVDPTKGLAMVLFAPTPEQFKEVTAKAAKAKDEGGDPMEAFHDMGAQGRFAVLVPVKNYAEFVKGLSNEATPAGALGKNGVTTITLPQGVKGFVRDLGDGYAVLGHNQEIVESFSGKSGAKALGKRLGKAGDALIDKADIFTVMNVEQVRPLIPLVVAEAKKAAAEQAEMMGRDPADVDRQMKLMNWVFDTAGRDTEVAVGSMRFSAAGVSGDLNLRLVEGSALGKAFAQGGSAGKLLAALPNQSFLLAGAVDLSLPGMRQIIKDFTAQATGPGMDQMALSGLASLEKADGQAAVVGVPVAGLMSGFLTQTVSFVASKNPGEYAASAKAALLAMDGQQQQGLKFNVTYKDGGAKVGDAPVDVYDAKVITGEDDQAMMAAQGLSMLFGPQGAPGGYVAKTDAGVYTTFSKNSELLGKALGVGKNPEQSLARDAGITETAGNLPNGRVAEGYWGVRQTLDQVLPFVGMMGIQVPMDKIPEKIPPIGAAISSDDGQARFSFFVPAPVIKAGVGIAEAAMDQMGGEEPQDDPEAPGKGGRTGQPRF